MDGANGYEQVAAEYIAARSDSGKTIVENWAASLPVNASVLDVGAGHGRPVSSAILKAGCQLSAIDASPTLVAALRENFPDVRAVCELAETSEFFGETFDGIITVGLMFLLSEEKQKELLRKIAAALNSKGRVLFSAPEQKCEWMDILTGQMSYGLGAETYGRISNSCGLTVIETFTDEGGSHYYDLEKTA
jgi:SAM-dependent methyltransferase